VQAGALAAAVLAAPARLGGSRLVCIDGRAGAGKTSLAADLAATCAPAGPVTTIHMDDLYEGWSGLPTVVDVVVDSLIEPWSAGRPGQLAVWDWRERRRLEAVPLELTPVVLLEGVGSWSRHYGDVVSALVWLECDVQTRRDRALGRDGALLEPRWDSWAADEDLVHGRERTRLLADLVIDTSDQRAAPLP
jgi:uridine kinase